MNSVINNWFQNVDYTQVFVRVLQVQLLTSVQFLKWLRMICVMSGLAIPVRYSLNSMLNAVMASSWRIVIIVQYFFAFVSVVNWASSDSLSDE